MLQSDAVYFLRRCLVTARLDIDHTLGGNPYTSDEYYRAQFMLYRLNRALRVCKTENKVFPIKSTTKSIMRDAETCERHPFRMQLMTCARCQDIRAGLRKNKIEDSIEHVKRA